MSGCKGPWVEKPLGLGKLLSEVGYTTVGRELPVGSGGRFIRDVSFTFVCQQLLLALIPILQR